MSKIEEIYAKLKAIFEDVPPPVVVQFTDYTLEDGVTIVSISKLEVGGEVKIGDAFAPAGTHVLQDGTSITVDDAGIITEVKPKKIVPSDPGPLETPEQMLAATQKFATGTPEERMANLELIAKALMEYSFGWQLREAEEKVTRDQAIATYKQGFEDQKAKNEKNELIIKEMFELVTELCKEPAADPLPVEKKQSAFSKDPAKISTKERIMAKVAELK